MNALKYCTLFVIFISISASAQDSQKVDKKEMRYQEILGIINSENYQFTARKANPQGGRQIDLTTRNNFLRVSQGVAAASMPYFGRSFSGGYSDTDSGINFDGQMETYDVQKNDKKRRLTIKFKIRGSSDTFSCTLNISGKDSASLSVSSNKRQMINYTGIIVALKDE